MKLYRKFFLTITLFAFPGAIVAAPQTVPTAPAAPAVVPPLPQIVEVDRPVVRSVDPKALPPPFHTESARRPSRQVPQPADAKLYVPKGFRVNVFAEGDLVYPRWMALAPNGDVFVADSRSNRIVVFRDTNKDGRADQRWVWSDKLDQPFGMAFHKDWFYVANTDAVVRFRYKPGQTQANGAPERLVELTRGGYNQLLNQKYSFFEGRKEDVPFYRIRIERLGRARS